MQCYNRMGVKIDIIPNGNLRFAIENEATELELRELLEDDNKSWDQKWSEFLDDLPGNGHLYSVAPEWIGALTEAPILATELDHPDHGDPTVPDTAQVWWYPQYEIKDPLEELIKTGTVFFTRAID